MAITDYFTQAFNQQSQPPVPQSNMTGAQTVMDTANSILGANSDYLANARRRGLETAAARGGINSSIAAGAAERSAMEAAQPLIQAALQRDQSALDVQRENWLSGQNFNRALSGQVFSSSLGMLQALQQAAINDPELYSPETVSGMGNFFGQDMADYLKRYLGG